MLLLALLAAQAAAPDPGQVHLFRDWTVGCDNGLHCEAVALLPEAADWDRWTLLSLQRGPAAGAQPQIRLTGIETRPASLWADGERLPVRFSADVDGIRIEADDMRGLIGALRRAQSLELRDAGGSTYSRVSLAGAAAAMLYMDERQGRLGTETALVDRGSRPASTVPPPPALPRVRIAPVATDPPIALDAARISALRRETGCTIDEVGGPDAHETLQIATGTTLILLACGTGAYNLSSVPFIARRQGGRVVTEVAPFDAQWGANELGRPTLINAMWDEGTRLLLEFSKGRGLGDCGTHARYGWDGARFRLIRQEEMGECRGSLDYITTWNVELASP